MPRFIDAHLLLDNLKKQYGEELGWQCTVNMSDVGMMIEDAPSVDVVGVTRCKDCKYWQDNNGGYPHEECRWWKDETPYADDFCSYGERKE